MSATRPPDPDAHRERSTPPHADDLRIVGETLAGSPAAVDRFVERMRCVPRFVAARNMRANRLLSREEEADLVQDVLTVVWRKLAGYAGEAALETWVYQFVEFEFRNLLRRRDRRRSASLDEASEDPSLLVEAPGQVDLEAVYLGLAALEPEERLVVRMKHFDALTFEDIASRLGISVNTIKSRYYRALDRLRDGLRDLEEGP